jgi:hypothetical protein
MKVVTILRENETLGEKVISFQREILWSIYMYSQC